MNSLAAPSKNDIVDVAQDGAPGAARDLGQEFPLRNGRVSKAQVGRRILDQDAALQIGLGLVDVPAHDGQRLLGHRQRQEIREIASADHAPGQVLGDQSRLDPRNHFPHARKVGHVQPFGTAQRQANAMQRDRIIAANGVQVSGRAAAAHVVLGVHLKPCNRGTLCCHDMMVPEAQPDPGSRPDRA